VTIETPHGPARIRSSPAAGADAASEDTKQPGLNRTGPGLPDRLVNRSTLA